MIDWQRTAIHDRSTWADTRGAIVQRVTADLIASVVADYDHQSGPRGVSTSQEFDDDVAMREAMEDYERTMRQIDEAVREKVTMAWYARRYPR